MIYAIILYTNYFKTKVLFVSDKIKLLKIKKFRIWINNGVSFTLVLL